MNIYRIIGSVFLGALLLYGCKQNTETLYQIDSQRVEATFPSEKLKVEMKKGDGNQFKVELWRGNTNGASSVPVVISLKAGKEGMIRPVKNSFDFADGSAVAEIAFEYDDLENFGAEVYMFGLKIDKSKVSHSGLDSLTVSSSRLLTYEEIGKVLYSDGFFEEDIPDVAVAKAKEGPVYRLLDLWADDNIKPGYHLTFVIEPNNKIKFNKQDTGFVHQKYGMIRFTEGKLKDGTVSYYDPATRTVHLIINYVVDQGSFGSAESTFVLPKI